MMKEQTINEQTTKRAPKAHDEQPTAPVAKDQQVVVDDLEALLNVLPPFVAEPLQSMPNRHDLLEVIMDLGREPEARFPGREVILGTRVVDHEDLAYVVQRVGMFGDDNRAGIERTLHRISAIRNRAGRIVGLTCRVGRAVFGTIAVIRDIVEAGHSILLLGRPGVGKTTMLREVARVLADDFKKRVVIVDTSNEIAGDGDIPHPAIGRARRMQVRTPTMQHAVMIEAVENHMPEVIVIDEIGTELEAAAARTIAERGVQLVATAHGNTLENLMMNPTLSDLVGGIQTVTLGDEEARRRRTQKSILERKAPPTFDVVVEIQNWNRVAVHMNVAEVVDSILRGQPIPPTLRWRDENGSVQTQVALAPRPPATTSLGGPSLSREQPAAREKPGRTRKVLRVYPYGVNRSRLEQIIRGLQLPVVLTMDLSTADVLLTIKNYFRRKPQPLRDAEHAGVPIHVLRSNTGAQIEEALEKMLQREMDFAGNPVIAETEAAIRQVIESARPVELSPQNAYIRRIQHELAGQYHLASQSTGREPNRRVRIFKPDQ